MRKLFITFMIAAMLAPVLFPSPARAIALGDMAPDFTVPTLSGREVSYFSDFKGKKPVYLVFWATW